MQLNPQHLTLNQLLAGRLFRIPDYQRAYAWETKQRKDLFADIREVQKTKQDHFLATVVGLARERRLIVANEFTAVEVVDGQQRLTTFVILLKAIEKALGTGGDENKIKQELHELLVKSDDHSLALLQTNHDSTHVFVDYIREGIIRKDAGETAADKNLIDAASECESFVEDWKRSASLIELVALLRNRLSMIYHELTDESAVYRVFEVLNSRGLDVRWIDKFKSQLMGLIFLQTNQSAEPLKEMHSIWQDIYRVLGLRNALGDQALRFAGTLKNSQKVNRLQSEEDAAATLVDQASGGLANTVGQARWLHSIVVALDRLDRDARLKAVTNIVHARFVATSIIVRQFPPDVERSLLAQWERVTFRIFGLGGADSRHKVGDYVRLGQEIFVDKLKAPEIVDRLLSIGSDYSIDAVLTSAKDYTNSYEGWTEELRYLLFRYDEHLAQAAGEKLNEFQWTKIWAADPSKSIEHIKPQSSNVSYVHHLGNLTMLPPGVNSSLQDKPPNEKAKSYKECGIRGTVAVANTIRSRTWDKVAVLARAQLIEDFVRKEWAN
ncbi:DUF262 domain-containing protein [Bradyrhizobium sp. 38]|uniref:DUF262 domain-containing protein n=1 Tax=unclassified Bradyrhizobium TaxID=2631580 RepID=UPI001FFB3E07|nr:MULTISPECIES: DUF262 domain-containing protein [unclassified Bradyrhizobium]MCK1339958.1 DUF262 domain-containing protein [Bradyrhizobium sp. 38]MCK1782184.1 DUF262 domain-containing protein [Bradyrhizobium sp. 132]